MVQDTLLDSFRAGRRSYTIFQVGKATLLRVSDVMKLKKQMSLILMEQSNKLHLFMIKKLVREIGSARVLAHFGFCLLCAFQFASCMVSPSRDMSR